MGARAIWYCCFFPCNIVLPDHCFARENKKTINLCMDGCTTFLSLFLVLTLQHNIFGHATTAVLWRNKNKINNQPVLCLAMPPGTWKHAPGVEKRPRMWQRAPEHDGTW